MSTLQDVNLVRDLEHELTEANQDDLNKVIVAYKHNLFDETLQAIQSFRYNYEMNERLHYTLTLIEGTCLAQTGDTNEASDALKALYDQQQDLSIDNLFLLSNIAYMNDYKLTRRIMSNTIKLLEAEEEVDHDKAAHGYLLLGEVEEQLEAYVRATRYNEKALAYLGEMDNPDRETVLFLHYKLGALHSRQNDIEEAINHLNTTLELAGDEYLDIKANSLVSIARMYSAQESYQEAINYLLQALPLLDRSSLANQYVHAEAYTELAYDYFALSQLTEAVLYYPKAIELHKQINGYSKREVGMIHMQYAYCLEKKDEPELAQAGIQYENAISELEESTDDSLLENALVDVINFFDRRGNQRKKSYYEKKAVRLTNNQPN
ncbi:tetratricopeptide repeat protein [Alkalibacillus salilacus]|uniref:Flp pilus assembly protein TadD n=1 Tax=Alkalibacillus salilacus TaxID=284582 RepID=A0ABT9VBD2_9BACI|nr:tetratricopeptide repeat protein [Alkalibacillus salilacus]MDQ0158253.1 Flp pilus assembly protein TadD [Alkalibacillus salilacus]